MIVGMDIYKDSAQKNMSVTAFVATMNNVEEPATFDSKKPHCTRYFSRCAMQQRGQEFSDSLRKFMKGKYFQNLNLVRKGFMC